jgi:hypothetical protein
MSYQADAYKNMNFTLPYYILCPLYLFLYIPVCGIMYICTHDHFEDMRDMIGGHMDENLERIPVFVPKAHKEELRKIAYEQRTSVSEEVRKAVAMYLDKLKEEQK